MIRPLLLATALLAALAAPACAGASDEVIAVPALRANVIVTSDVVLIGDVIDNAGPAAQIPIYRSPDLGTTGTLPTAQVIATLRAHQVIGVDVRDLREITVTRPARTLAAKDIEREVARALERRNGLGEAANLTLTFDRDISDTRLAASNSGALTPVATRFEPRGGRFDVTFEISDDAGAAATRLHFTGRAVETVEVAVATHSVDRGELLKSADLVTERRPKAEVGPDAAPRDKALGMQLRKGLRAGQAVTAADLAKPDLVQRDQSVTLIYEAGNIYLTIRGKALDNGSEGDVVNVLNLQSKRTVAGVVTGRAQVQVQVAAPRPAAPVAVPSAEAPSSPQEEEKAPPAASVSLAASNNPQIAAKTE